MENNVNVKPTKPKEKRRNNEKRKEKSRDAARCRRSRETEIFTELAGALPLNPETISQLDKASIMRLAISYLKVRNIVDICSPEIKNEEKKPCEAEQEATFLKALDGFMAIISAEGDIIYLSENVSNFLGISQVDLMGQNIYEYSHPCDHDELKDILSNKAGDNDQNAQKSFFLRLKCTLTSKGRNVNLKSATYKVIHFTGHMVVPMEEKDDSHQTRCLLAIAQPIPHPANIEVPLDKKTFLSKHTPDMKFIYVDEKLMEVLSYESEDLIGKPVYDYHHALDSDLLCSDFKSLFAKGQCETIRYRFLAKYGGYVWVVTQATILYDKLHKAQSVVCVHHVISDIECEEEIYSLSQLSSQQAIADSKSGINDKILRVQIPTISPSAVISNNHDIDVNDNIILEQKPHSPILLEPPPTIIVESATENGSVCERPQTATSKIFAPRTEEMNKGFLMFSDEEPGLTILKDEPDDLTHLAPTAGDVCVPLADNPFLTEMFDEFILDDNYCSLLPADLNSLDSQSSKASVNDPFMVYRNEYDICKSDLSNSPQLLSPNLSKSPGGCSQMSLCSPGNSLSEDDQLNSFISLQMDSEDEPELITKAPYIPMSLTEDLPVLMSEDLMWGAMPDDKISKLSSSSVSPSPSISPPIISNSVTSLNSSLAQLLCQKQQNTKSIKAHDHGGGLVNPSDVLEQMYIKGVTNHWSVDENSIQLGNKNDIISNKPINNFNNKLANIPNTNERAHKRLSTNGNQYDVFSKRSRNNDPKEKLSSELLNQLMSNTNTRQHSKNSRNNNDWTNSQRNEINKTTSHQPSDSVLMNLLVSGFDVSAGYICIVPQKSAKSKVK